MKKGSITVEASFVLPIFLFFILGFYYFFTVLSVQDSIQEALTDTARELSVQAYFEEKDSKMSAYLLFAKNIGNDYYGKPCVVGGVISLADSYFEEKNIVLFAKYRLRIPLPIWNKKILPMQQKVSMRKFIGRDRREEPGYGEGGLEAGYVYITETGTVYHITATCSHLKLSIREINMDCVEEYRNQGGAKYKACERCTKRSGGQKEERCYITTEGNRYHMDRACSGLKRTVKKVPLQQVKGFGACKRCGK